MKQSIRWKITFGSWNYQTATQCRRKDEVMKTKSFWEICFGFQLFTLQASVFALLFLFCFVLLVVINGCERVNKRRQTLANFVFGEGC